MIGDSIVVKILGVSKGGTVRLGVKAPAEVNVFREELIERVQASGGRIKRKEKS